MKVWILSTGSGDDGDAWQLLGVYSTHDLAMLNKARYEREVRRPDGSTYHHTANEPEEVVVDEPVAG